MLVKTLLFFSVLKCIFKGTLDTMSDIGDAARHHFLSDEYAHEHDRSWGGDPVAILSSKSKAVPIVHEDVAEDERSSSLFHDASIATQTYSVTQLDSSTNQATTGP